MNTIGIVCVSLLNRLYNELVIAVITSGLDAINSFAWRCMSPRSPADQ